MVQWSAGPVAGLASQNWTCRTLPCTSVQQVLDTELLEHERALLAGHDGAVAAVKPSQVVNSKAVDTGVLRESILFACDRR